jgi:membrane-bound lytic murein transglycosylase D
MPSGKVAPLTALDMEDMAFSHVRVREQFISWYGGCRAQARLHKALDRGEEIYFPIIEKEALEHFPEALKAEAGEIALIDALKALVVVESMVNTNAISWAGAGGPWQFMRPTFSRIARRLGEEDPYPAEDLRFDWPVASRAAFELTRENIKAFQWTKSPLSCAIMAYNGGIYRVSQALKRQKKSDCRELKYTRYSTPTYIATETYRYQPRIVMVLMVMAWRRAKGYDLPPRKNYVPKLLEGEGAIRLQELAQKAGADYDMLIKMNRRYPLGVTPLGKWQLMAKDEDFSALSAALPTVDRLSDEHLTAMLKKAAPLDIVLLLGEDAFRYYTVRKGDNVSTICRRFGITKARLLQLNKALFAKNKKRSHGREWTLYVGQKLRLPGLHQLLLE